MKTLIDYLEKYGKYEHRSHQEPFTCELCVEHREPFCDANIVLKVAGDMHTIDLFYGVHNAVGELQDILQDDYGVEIRFCEECGKPMDVGYIAGDGDWYCCEDCFEEAMNEAYGEGNWRKTEAEGSRGGFYEYLDGEEWVDTGIYDTAWND